MWPWALKLWDNSRVMLNAPARHGLLPIARRARVPMDCAIWAFNHIGEEMQKRSEKRCQEMDMA